MAIAMGLAGCTRLNFCLITSIFQGLMVGIPQPSLFLRASAAASTMAGFVPSPVKAAIPALAQAETKISLYCKSVYLSP
jgi:hypothetical protein